MKKFFTAIALSICAIPSCRASMGELELGSRFVYSNVTKFSDALKDYNMFYSVNTDYRIVNNLLKDNAIEFLSFPMCFGINAAYSFFFTDSFGIGCRMGWQIGNFRVLTITRSKFAEYVKKYEEENNDSKEPLTGISENLVYKLFCGDLNFDILLEWDFLSNIHNFTNYSRYGWCLIGSLGASMHFLIEREFMPDGASIATFMEDNKDKTKEKEFTLKDKIADKISLFNIGIVGGISTITPINIGLALEGNFFFNNLFQKPTIAKVNDEIKNNDENADPEAKYSVSSKLWQVAMNLFYDFAPLINSYEVANEIDIENW